MLFHDRAIIDGPARITREGHFVARARVARANNVQDYRPDELGLQPKADGSPYRIFRPAAAVFAKDSLATAVRRPIVVDHPSVDVDDSNRETLSVGYTGGEILRDGETMVVPIKITGKDAVRKIQSTHREFSWGYAADLDLTPGVFGDQAYDGSITPPSYNHLAICRRARGGSDLRVTDSLVILDERSQEKPMKIKIGDAEVDPTNGEAVSVAVKALDAKLETLTTQNGELSKSLTDANAKVATLETEKATLETKLADAALTPEKLRDAAKSYADAQAKAKALNVAITDSMGEADIRKAVVGAKMGDKAKDWTDAQIDASFAVLTNDLKVGDGARPLSGAPVKLGDARTAADSARKARLAHLESAHLGTQAA